MCEKRNMSVLDYRSDICYVYVIHCMQYFANGEYFLSQVVVDKDKDKITPSCKQTTKYTKYRTEKLFKK